MARSLFREGAATGSPLRPKTMYSTVGMAMPRNSNRNGLSSSCCMTGTGSSSGSSSSFGYPPWGLRFREWADVRRSAADLLDTYRNFSGSVPGTLRP